MRRHIIIGDIHGCFDEVSELLSRLEVSADDVVIAAGDLTRKGPAPDRCMELWIERGYRAVLGNQDAKVLARARQRISRLLSSRADRRILRRRDLLKAIAGWPLTIDLPEAGVGVVHGGVMPDGSIPREAALEL